MRDDGPAHYPIGTTIVEFTATDGCGNRASATSTVTVVDTTPPVVTCTATPANADDEWSDEIPYLIEYAASDACSLGSVFAVIEPGADTDDEQPDTCEPLAVEDGQLIEIECGDDDCEVSWDDFNGHPILELDYGRAELYAVAQDASGNVAECSVELCSRGVRENAMEIVSLPGDGGSARRELADGDPMRTEAPTTQGEPLRKQNAAPADRRSRDPGRR